LNPETPTPTKHLAVLRQPFLDLILGGKKTIESRFLKRRNKPYNAVKAGDLVVMKKSGGLVLGEFTVSKVETFSDLTPEIVRKLLKKNAKALCVSDDPSFWEPKQNSKYAVLIHIEKPIRYKEPYSFPKRDMRGWVVL